MEIGRFLKSILHEATKWNKWIECMIEYKGYVGWFKFNEKTGLFEGRVSNVQSWPITFQGKTSEDIRMAFRESINEYLNWCKEQGKTPERPLKDDILKEKFPYDH